VDLATAEEKSAKKNHEQQGPSQVRVVHDMLQSLDRGERVEDSKSLGLHMRKVDAQLLS
jgi:hypothetical protein